MCSKEKDIRLSKSLSWLLRHGACEEGFKLSPEGYVKVEDILQHKKFKGKCKVEDIQRVVEQNAKQRFSLTTRNGCLEIKANQGHSIKSVTTAGLTPITAPIYKTVVHGTFHECWESIKRDGLHRMSRNHIHFAKGTLDDSSVISGLRPNAEILIYINLHEALLDGLPFYESDNGVILTSGDEKGYLKPKYFQKAVCISTEQAVQL